MEPTGTYFSSLDFDPEQEREKHKRGKTEGERDGKTVTKRESRDEKETARVMSRGRECLVVDERGMRWNQD